MTLKNLDKLEHFTYLLYQALFFFWKANFLLNCFRYRRRLTWTRCDKRDC